jgi:SAM-dependent methyltransferase
VSPYGVRQIYSLLRGSSIDLRSPAPRQLGVRATGCSRSSRPHPERWPSPVEGLRSISTGRAAAVAPGGAFGIDIEPRQVGAARALAAQRSARHVQFETGSIYELPFPDASFDAVYAQALLVHLSAPVAALNEMRRVLKPGGFAGVVDGDLGCMLIGPASAAIEKLVALQARDRVPRR